mgnify:CR=1 FL=1
MIFAAVGGGMVLACAGFVWFNNPRINRLNEKLAALADGKDIFYIDINEVFDDENGNLRADASGDSTHVYAKYDLDWCDWLCTKAIGR